MSHRDRKRLLQNDLTARKKNGLKIALINPLNPDPPPSYYGPSYGLSLLGALLKRTGHTVHGMDFERCKAPRMLDAAEASLKNLRPDIIGISCMSPNRAAVAALVGRLKQKHHKAAVIIGGPFPTQQPELMLSRCPADFAVLGDGEETLAELVEALQSGRSAAGIPGLALRANGGIRRTKDRGPFTALDSLPYPDFDLFDAARALSRHRESAPRSLPAPVSASARRCKAMHSALMVLGSRGCVYRCVYCPMSLSGGKPRAHSPEYFLGMVAHLSRKYRQKEFVFGDNHFTWDRDWVTAVCAGLVRMKLGLDWICMTRADRVDKKLLAQMRAAGCREVSYGLESGSPAMQRGIGKNLSLARAKSAFADTRKAGIGSVLMMMVGNPGDSRTTVRETAAFARDLDPDRVLVQTTKVYPGTRLHEIAEKRGVIPAGYYEGDEHRAPDYTGEMSREELLALRDMLQRRTSHISIGGGCNNGCCFLAGGAPGLSTQDLRGMLSQAALRAERVVLGGGEPLMRRDLPELLNTADAIGLNNLIIYTNARLLAYADRIALLRAHKAVHLIQVPLFSIEPQVHDGRTRAPGAFAQAALGLRSWRRTGGEVNLNVFLDRSFIGRGKEWVRWMGDLGVRQTVMCLRRSPTGWGQVSWDRLPRLEELADDLRAAHEEARRLKIELLVFGMPECILSDAEVPHYESRFVFDDLIRPAGEPLNLGRRRRESLRERPRACRGCAASPLCEGVWKGYPARHGQKEFRKL